MGKTEVRPRGKMLAPTSTQPTLIDKMLQKALGAVNSEIELAEKRLTNNADSIPYREGVGPGLDWRVDQADPVAGPPESEPRLSVQQQFSDSPKILNKKGKRKAMLDLGPLKKKPRGPVRQLHSEGKTTINKVKTKSKLPVQVGNNSGGLETDLSTRWEDLMTNMGELLKRAVDPIMARLEKIEEILSHLYPKEELRLGAHPTNKPEGIRDVAASSRCSDHLIAPCIQTSSEANSTPNLCPATSTTGREQTTRNNTMSNTGSSPTVRQPPSNDKVIPPCTGRREGDPHVLPCINLPPAATPYVTILTGVPPLSTHGKESHIELRNKCLHWLVSHKNFMCARANDILVVRRVEWIGPTKKTIAGDCVIINYRNPHIGPYLLRSPTNSGHLKTRLLLKPLEYFYPGPGPPPNRNQGSSLESKAPWPLHNMSQPVFSQSYLPFNIPLANRFSPLEEVD